MRYRVFSAVLAAVLLLCGCSSAASAPPRLLPDNLSNERVIPRDLAFLVDSAEDPVYRQAAELFARKVSQFTDGALNIRVLASVQPVTDFLAGEARFTFVEGRHNSGFSPDFPLLTQPLLYSDYQRFTMGLNSDSMMSALNEPLRSQRRATLLAAFYHSSNQLISNRPPTDGALPLTTSDGQAFRGAARADSGLEAILLAYGLEVETVSDTGTRVQQLLDEEVMVAEFSPEELRATDWQAHELYLLNTGHSPSPWWLVVDSELYGQLTPAYQAAIQEAVAYLFPLIDNYYLERDTQLLLDMRSQGVNVAESFPALKGVADKLIGQETASDYRKKYLIDLLLDLG